MNTDTLKTDGPDSATAGITVTVTLGGVTSQVTWDEQIPLLDALLSAGIAVPYSCCRGQCGTCVCQLQEGEVRLRRNYVLSATHLESGLILTCVASPQSSHIRINYDTL
ncbi:2Fe-2S iron-sulfur cluster binding domain-containing protein [Chitinophaga oryzae]|uniref:2Fe-2S iron-sulfur cluster binding domain-containing protein n=1 Tax=Chitinophaga oryzae TaxID=2725414 RepID=A0AAE7D5U1_9BACT|nr:2Fe-2S iron-sulfur cluster-binding protein [Chitinophaga oryzae]QJB30449.1 2Fe-2S iron-sulfur cluster binding domain-containing protein [Chitinophaga oryzae]QJB36959.1 2Fe-2S iron-sulfur cluster binding domain-containing protein [Chitinophaga oryzae]